MGQIKKAHLREAILASAHAAFASHGYQATSVPRIAAGAGISTANVYVYFRSKLDILYAIYDPWLRARLMRLEAELQLIPAPRERMKHLFRTLWRDIPAEENGFVNNIMQALSTAVPDSQWRPTLLRWMEAHLARLFRSCLDPNRRRQFSGADIGHFLVMAFDGYIIHHRIDPAHPLDEATLDVLVKQFCANTTAARPRARRPEPARLQSGKR